MAFGRSSEGRGGVLYRPDDIDQRYRIQSEGAEMRRQEMGQDDYDLLIKALSLFESAQEYEEDFRDAAYNDLEFLVGNQWDTHDISARTRGNFRRPYVTINRLPHPFRIALNSIMKGRPDIEVLAVDNESDQEIAGLIEGLIRGIERESNARIAYNNAHMYQVAIGLGHWHVYSDWAKEDASGTQDLRIGHVSNPLGVYWDPSSVLPTRADASWCFRVEDYTNEEFKRTFPEASVAGWDSYEEYYRDYLYGWSGIDWVRVAEFWWIEDSKRLLALTPDGRTIDATNMNKQELGYRHMMGEIQQLVERPTHKVKKALLSSMEVLDGPTEWPGTMIPVVPVVGEELMVGEALVRYGMVRHAKDPQKLLNYARSTDLELLSRQLKDPILATPEQIDAHKLLWDEPGALNRPYLLYDHQEGVNMPNRLGTPQASTQISDQANRAEDEIKGTTGIYSASLGQESNERSGRAILARREQTNVGLDSYMTNAMMSYERTGKILSELIPIYYSTDRMVRIVGNDRASKLVQINAIDPQTGQIKNDLTRVRYDIAISSGPGYATRREEAAAVLIDLAQNNPDFMSRYEWLIFKMMDWPFAREFSEHAKRMMDPTILPPEELKPEQVAQIQATQQSQDQQYELAMRKEAAAASKDETSAMLQRARSIDINMDVVMKAMATNPTLLKLIEKVARDEARQATLAKLTQDQAIRQMSGANGSGMNQ